MRKISDDTYLNSYESFIKVCFIKGKAYTFNVCLVHVFLVARPKRIELLTNSLEGYCSILLSYGRN